MTLQRAMIALLFCASAAFAQTSTARVTGVVRDPSSAIVPQAHVRIINRATGVESQTNTNTSGIYTISFLAPGPYEMKVEANGFKSYTRTNLQLETGDTLSLDISLEVGAVGDSVTISASAPLLQSETSSSDSFIENATIRNMPLATRRVGSLMRLLGNVSFNSEESWEGIPNFSIAGGRGRQQQWQLDGGNLQGVMMVTGIASVAPPVDAIEEFRVESNSYPAEFGRTTGGFISMTTKSGTNDFHGSAYEFLRNDALNARNFFSATKAPLKYNVFGGTLGGPIHKNKTFFFFSYEGTRRRDGVTRILNVPTAEEVQGDFQPMRSLFLIL